MDIKNDAVNHPSHYCDGRTIEPIDVFSDWALAFTLGNACKYVSRLGRKLNTIEDIDKAIFYLNYEIKKPTQPYNNKTNHKITPEMIKNDWKLNDTIYDMYKEVFTYMNDLNKTHLYNAINSLQVEKNKLKA